MNLQILELREVVPRTTFSECKNCTAEVQVAFPQENTFRKSKMRFSSTQRYRLLKFALECKNCTAQNIEKPSCTILTLLFLLQFLNKKTVGLLPSFALDLTTNGDDGEPWDFTLEEHRQRARRKVDDVKPYMLVGSPACAPYSTL